MIDLRDDKKVIERKRGWSIPKFNIILFLITYKSNILKVIGFLLVCLVLFMPLETASVIAGWVNRFVGTLVNKIKF
jgi:hypothetical protein